MKHLYVGVALAALVAPVAVYAQETTGTVRGSVVTADGSAVPNAEVELVHAPSGTRATVTSDASGGFSASGLRLGGPYELTVTAEGFDPVSQTLQGLQAGAPQRAEIVLAGAGDTITVTGTRVRSAVTLGGGAATVLSERDIAGIAAVNRDIRNLAARDPLVSLDPTNGGAISIAGQNNRFNRFTVDGIAFGDPFGLEAGGLVSTRGPVPLDAIGEFSVEVAPVDIQQGFFQGGAINAQLKSGGNDFTALAGYYYAADSLRGVETRGGVRRDGEFTSKIFTLQATGPIIRDRLFFAVTWERLRDRVPADINPAVLGVTDGQITQIQQIADSVYSFDALGVATDVAENDDKVVAKLDFNIADGHRLAATYIYNEGNVLAGQTGAGQINATNPTLSLQSNNYNQGAINHFGALQLNNQWTDSFSTQLRATYADYTRLQVPFGDRSFGQFQVCLDAASAPAPLVCPTGVRRIQFGPDISRQANELFSTSYSIEAQATLQMNNHSVKFIAERRLQDVTNLFAQRVSGAWYFDSVADLQARRANEVDFAAPLLGGIDTVTAAFENNSWTFGIQDTWDISDTLVATYGFRYDLFDSPDRPFFNQAFLTRLGFPNTATLNGRDLIQPRIGVNWKPTTRLTARVAGGLYGGGSPNVWISNNFSNPGPTLGRVQVRRAADGTFTVSGIGGLSAADVQALGAATLNNVSGGTGIPAELITRIQGLGAENSPTNALDPNFRAPSQWRISGSVDYEANLGPLGDGWNVGADVVWSRVKDALTWTDLRSVPVGTLPDGRPRYAPINTAAGVNTDMLLTNTDQGYGWNIVGRFDKRWTNGFRVGGAYTFQRVKDVNSGTSSVAGSNYNNSAALDPNNAAYGTANYQRDNAYRLWASYDASIFGDNNTRVEIFFNSQSGQRFSYTFADQASGSARSSVFGTTGTNNRYLMYVPNVDSASADANVIYAPGFDFAGFQQFIQNSELAEYQGKIAPKNLGQSARFNKVDLSVRQELPLPLGGKFELFADMENVLNFINKEWGSLRQVAFPYYGTLVNVTCANAPCSQYVYANRQSGGFQAPQQVVNLAPSLWALRIGGRIRF
ncbi:TonB-dependent receptor [Sphingomonas sp. 37zxx]|uniref:TonB-dependent receptor n=1 Tax=Sphingomonas sp. 37zxx TaxID=1550073 RepID=UPI00053C0042|nr:carboxypeptidase regulatory-like domain-containing protein [Sphingomonas sp. 37zxx]